MSDELLILKGETFSLEVRWEDRDRLSRVAITAISYSHGAPRLTAADHGIPDGWRGYVSLVAAPTQINANCPPRESDWQELTVIDSDTVELNAVTPVDDNGRQWADYTSGGFINFYPPVDLTGYTARMQIKDKIGGTVIASTDDVLDVSVIPSEYKTTVVISAENTATLSAKRGVATLEMVSSTGVVKRLKLTRTDRDVPDPVRIVDEVTT